MLNFIDLRVQNFRNQKWQLENIHNYFAASMWEGSSRGASKGTPHDTKLPRPDWFHFTRNLTLQLFGKYNRNTKELFTYLVPIFSLLRSIFFSLFFLISTLVSRTTLFGQWFVQTTKFYFWAWRAPQLPSTLRPLFPSETLSLHVLEMITITI